MSSQCDLGHESHATQIQPVQLQSHYLDLPDAAGIADRFHQSVSLEIVSPSPIEIGYGKYCPYSDGISESLIKQGVWEAQETTVVLDILRQTIGLVIDIGAHVGWYTVLAGDHPVLAIEADPMYAAILQRNVDRNGINAKVLCEQVTETSEIVADGDIALLKIDIEGGECSAVKALWPDFAERRIQYALIEISPIFTNDGRSSCDYPILVSTIAAQGYDIFQVPGKGWEHNDAYREQPLETLHQYCQLSLDGLEEYVAGLRQENFIFARRG